LMKISDTIATILGWVSIVVFKWPAFIMISLLITIELIIYFFLRSGIYFLENFRFCRSHRKLRRKVRQGESISNWTEWKEAAKLLDKYDGREAWKAESNDPIYNYKIIEKLVLEIHTTRLQIAELLKTQPLKTDDDLSSPHMLTQHSDILQTRINQTGVPELSVGVTPMVRNQSATSVMGLSNTSVSGYSTLKGTQLQDNFPNYSNETPYVSTTIPLAPAEPSISFVNPTPLNLKANLSINTNNTSNNNNDNVVKNKKNIINPPNTTTNALPPPTQSFISSRKTSIPFGTPQHGSSLKQNLTTSANDLLLDTHKAGQSTGSLFAGRTLEPILSPQYHISNVEHNINQQPYHPGLDHLDVNLGSLQDDTGISTIFANNESGKRIDLSQMGGSFQGEPIFFDSQSFGGKKNQINFFEDGKNDDEQLVQVSKQPTNHNNHDINNHNHNTNNNATISPPDDEITIAGIVAGVIQDDDLKSNHLHPISTTDHDDGDTDESDTDSQYESTYDPNRSSISKALKKTTGSLFQLITNNNGSNNHNKNNGNDDSTGNLSQLRDKKSRSNVQTHSTSNINDIDETSDDPTKHTRLARISSAISPREKKNTSNNITDSPHYTPYSPNPPRSNQLHTPISTPTATRHQTNLSQSNEDTTISIHSDGTNTDTSTVNSSTGLTLNGAMYPQECDFLANQSYALKNLSLSPSLNEDQPLIDEINHNDDDDDDDDNNNKKNGLMVLDNAEGYIQQLQDGGWIHEKNNKMPHSPPSPFTTDPVTTSPLSNTVALSSHVTTLTTRLKQHIQTSTDTSSLIANLIHLVQLALRQQAAILNEELYTRTNIGTKYLITTFNNEIIQALNLLATLPDQPAEKRLELFLSLSKLYGHNALLLSGGAGFCGYHWGLAKTLVDNDMLSTIKVISGTSAGSLIAAHLCTRTDEELQHGFDATIISENMKFDNGVTPIEQVKSLFTNGFMIDSNEWAPILQYHCCGDMTFLEAFQKTGRVLVITATPPNKNEPPIFLSYLTAPHVIIRSACVASASIPFLLPPSQLLFKNPVNGAITEDTVIYSKLRDGSFSADIPNIELAYYFNTSFHIVSQVNPHINLFYFNRTGTSGRSATHWGWSEFRGTFLLSFFESLLKFDMIKNLQIMKEMKLYPEFASVGDVSSLFLQNFSGPQNNSICLVPDTELVDYMNLLKAPTPDDLKRMIKGGELMLWFKKTLIDSRFDISKAILNGIQLAELDLGKIPK